MTPNSWDENVAFAFYILHFISRNLHTFIRSDFLESLQRFIDFFSPAILRAFDKRKCASNNLIKALSLTS
jgi:hypothetical protein